MTLAKARVLIAQAAAQKLTELDLSGLGLTQVPPEVAVLSELEVLILGKRKGDERTYVYGRRVPAVTSNAISAVSDFVGTLQNLRRLDLSGNPLAQVPAVVYEFPKLESLGLCRILLNDLPAEVTNIQTLQQLDLSGNVLSTLPDAIANLVNLQSLDLGSNQFTSLPDAIAKLFNLQSLSLSSNQFNAQSARDIKAILDELSEEYNPENPKGQEKIKTNAIERIRENPQLRKRTFQALKSAGEEALDLAIQHPVAKVVIEGIKGFLSPEIDGE
jgi:Leucine-rich repeat (LRR) protein